jgi:integrase
MKDGKPIRAEYAEAIFQRAVLKAGITSDSRKLVVHSLRFTFVTRMRRELSAEAVSKMAGHSSVEQTDYYTSKKVLEDLMHGLTDPDTIYNNLFV